MVCGPRDSTDIFGCWIRLGLFSPQLAIARYEDFQFKFQESVLKSP